jgi:hypothetical protein
MTRFALRRSPRFALSIAALATAAVVAPGIAAADPTTDAALRAFVAAIDASPDWNATFQGLATGAGGASVLTGLSIQSAVAGMSITADTLTVTKGTTGGDGHYAAGKVTAGNVTVAEGPLTITLANLELDDFSAPGGLAFKFDPAKPFSSMVGAYQVVAKTHLGMAHVGALALNQVIKTTTNRVTYNDVTLTRLDSGRITTLSAGPLTSQSPVPDKANLQPLVAMTVAHADAKDIDLAALLHVYDPPPAAGAARAFQPAIANVTYQNTAIQLAPRDTPSGPAYSVAIKLGTVSLDDLRVRPPLTSIADDLDRSVGAPFQDDAVASDPAGMINLLSAYSIGHLSASPIDVTPPGIGVDPIHLDAITVANLSLDGLGELDLTGLTANASGFGSLKAGKLAIGGLAFPSGATLETAYKTAVAGGDVDRSSLAPTLGFVEADGIDANVAAPSSVATVSTTHLGKLRLDFANNVGNIPTSVKIDLEDADLDAALMPGIARSELAHYGYSRLVVDAAGQVAWNQSKSTTTVSGLKLSAKNVGTVTVDAVLNGPALADIQQLGKASGLNGFDSKLSLVSGTLSFKDDSIVGRVLADQATGLKVDPDKFRDQFARGLPFMLLPVGTSSFQKTATPVFQDFVRAPGTLTFTAAPAMPIALPALIDAAHGSAVFNLPTLLNLTVSGIPGPTPVATPAPGPSPAPLSAPAPAPVAPVPPAAPAPAAPATPPQPAPSGDIRGTVTPPK